MEAGTGLTVLGAALGSAKLVEKLLGPTADYVGQGLRDWTEKRVANIHNIFHIAADRLGEDLDKEGGVPPRILKGILDEGSFCDDPLMAEYFGGVLASSRTNVSHDDRGMAFLSVISNLSAYQVRSHYIFYILFHRDFKGSKLDTLYPRWSGAPLLIYMPYTVYAAMMNLQDDEDVAAIAAHSLNGLERNSLTSSFAYGTPEKLRVFANIYCPENIKSEGLMVGFAPFGAELFCYVHGQSNFRSVNDFLSSDMNVDLINGINIPDGYVKLVIQEQYKKDYLSIV